MMNPLGLFFIVIAGENSIPDERLHMLLYAGSAMVTKSVK
jgi:hypothetical protein